MRKKLILIRYKLFIFFLHGYTRINFSTFTLISAKSPVKAGAPILNHSATIDSLYPPYKRLQTHIFDKQWLVEAPHFKHWLFRPCWGHKTNVVERFCLIGLSFLYYITFFLIFKIKFLINTNDNTSTMKINQTRAFYLFLQHLLDIKELYFYLVCPIT